MLRTPHSAQVVPVIISSAINHHLVNLRPCGGVSAAVQSFPHVGLYDRESQRNHG